MLAHFFQIAICAPAGRSQYANTEKEVSNAPGKNDSRTRAERG
jgi:hypothetical protein